VRGNCLKPIKKLIFSWNIELIFGEFDVRSLLKVLVKITKVDVLTKVCREIGELTMDALMPATFQLK
jgi:hypothetical protein